MSTQPLGFSPDHLGDGSYLERSLSVTYRFHSGKRAIPTAHDQGGSSGQNCEIVTVSRPQFQKVVAFTLRRMVAYPEPPDPTPTSASEELIQAEITYPEPELNGEGEFYVWTVSGCFVYAKTTPFSLTECRPPRSGIDATPTQHEAPPFATGLLP